MRITRLPSAGCKEDGDRALHRDNGRACSRAAYVREAIARLAADRVVAARALATARCTAVLEQADSTRHIVSMGRRLDRKLKTVQRRVDRVLASRDTTWQRHRVRLEEAFDELAAELSSVVRDHPSH